MAPLSQTEMGALDPTSGSVIVLRNGVAEELLLSDARRVEPADWLDLADWSALGPPTSLAAPVPVPVETVQAVEFSAHAKLGGVPLPDPGVEAILASLRGEVGGRSGAVESVKTALLVASGIVVAGVGRFASAMRRGNRGRAQPTAEHGSSEAFGNTPLPGWVLTAVSTVASLVSAIAGRLKGMTSESSETSPDPAHAPPPSPGLFDRLHRLLALLAMRSPLGAVLSRRQAQYVARMMELFERGQLAEALRHAIPLDGLSGGRPSVVALGVPSPRDDLRISPHLAAGGSGLGATASLYEELQRLYRRAFERLRDEGRFEEAAFVLAELLHVNEEAVAFLETHGRLRLAAELAEARNLDPALVVRQWWIAGDRDRAVAIARRTGAFAGAVTRLDRSDASAAAELRTAWAESLAAAGDYAQAVEVIWPVPERRDSARDWMERVIRIGGAGAARMLARKVVLAPEAAVGVRAAVLSLLADRDPEAASDRRTFARTLRMGDPTPLASTLARATARAVARDSGQGLGDVSRNDYLALLDFTGDAALRADAPTLVRRAPVDLRSRAEPLRWRIDEGDAGTYAIRDAAYLPGGRCVVALGEAGVRLLSRQGRTVAHFDQPAHHLVVSDHGDRVIALAERGGVFRLARIDLLARTARPWCEAELECFAGTFDGSAWLVAVHGDFLALDATAPGLSTLWNSRAVGKRILTIARDRAHASLLTLREVTTDAAGRPVESWERWTYDLPGLILRYRPALDDPCLGGEAMRRVSPAGVTCTASPDYSDEDLLTGCALRVNGKEVAVGDDIVKITYEERQEFQLRPVLSDDWIAFWTTRESGVECWLADTGDRQVRANWMLLGATHATLRFQEDVLTVADDRGRVMVINLQTGDRVRDLRVT